MSKKRSGSNNNAAMPAEEPTSPTLASGDEQAPESQSRGTPVATAPRLVSTGDVAEILVASWRFVQAIDELGLRGENASLRPNGSMVLEVLAKARGLEHALNPLHLPYDDPARHGLRVEGWLDNIRMTRVLMAMRDTFDEILEFWNVRGLCDGTEWAELADNAADLGKPHMVKLPTGWPASIPNRLYSELHRQLMILADEFKATTERQPPHGVVPPSMPETLRRVPTPDQPIIASQDCASVAWLYSPKPFLFSKRQRLCVSEWYDAWQTGAPAVGDQHVATEAGLEVHDGRSPSRAISELFKPHAAWGTMIVPASKDSHRLTDQPPKKN